MFTVRQPQPTFFANYRNEAARPFAYEAQVDHNMGSVFRKGDER